jgi:hypothetical protein
MSVLYRRCAVLSLEGKDYISRFAIVASTVIAVVGGVEPLRKIGLSISSRSAWKDGWRCLKT